MAAQACLTELDLSDNAFGPVGVEALVGFLTSPSCFTLKVARFNNNGLGIKGGTVSTCVHFQLFQNSLRMTSRMISQFTCVIFLL